jgi:ATP-dependent helicase YprA (DUF1998 family)
MGYPDIRYNPPSSGVHSMGNLEELRRRYEELMRQCEKCRNPSICPTCSIAKRMVEISMQLDSEATRGSGGETDERT